MMRLSAACKGLLVHKHSIHRGFPLVDIVVLAKAAGGALLDPGPEFENTARSNQTAFFFDCRSNNPVTCAAIHLALTPNPQPSTQRAYEASGSIVELRIMEGSTALRILSPAASVDPKQRLQLHISVYHYQTFCINARNPVSRLQTLTDEAAPSSPGLQSHMDAHRAPIDCSIGC